MCFCGKALPFNKVGCTSEIKNVIYFCFSLHLHYLCSSWVRVCLSLLISIIAAHLQHVHANGLFNNGLHFRKVSDAVFYLHLSGIGKYKGLMDIVFLYLQKNTLFLWFYSCKYTLFLQNGQIKTTLFQWFLYKNIPNKPYWLVWDMDFICGYGFGGFWLWVWYLKIRTFGIVARKITVEASF